MIVGFSRHGKGDGAGVVGYISDGAEAIGYAVGITKAGKPRDPAPVVVRGDPVITRHLIDLVPHRWKYTSGMISFSPDERITPETEQRIMNEFERCAFAGLDRQRYDILWVRHQDGPGKCHHLHFVTPRMDLLTGKSLNIAPPGKASRELFDTIRSKLNAELGLSDPDDPMRIQPVRLPHHLARARSRQERPTAKEQTRILIARQLEAKARLGAVKNREDVIQQLLEAGFVVTREGNDYLTVQHSDTGERVRLRGGLFDRHQCEQVVRNLADQHRESSLAHADLAERLECLVTARAGHNRERYGIEAGTTNAKEKRHDRTGEPTSDSRTRDRTVTPRTRGEIERTLEGFDGGTRRFERAARSVVQPGHCLGRAIECVRGQWRERQLDERLIDKYGAPHSAPPIELERGWDRELERELV